MDNGPALQLVNHQGKRIAGCSGEIPAKGGITTVFRRECIKICNKILTGALEAEPIPPFAISEQIPDFGLGKQCYLLTVDVLEFASCTGPDHAGLQKVT